MGEEGPCEAGMVRLADQRLYALFRTGGDGYIGNGWSTDDGKTWTKPVSTPYKGVALRVRRLSNGILACTTGRPGPVVVMFSLDGTGEKWRMLLRSTRGRARTIRISLRWNPESCWSCMTAPRTAGMRFLPPMRRRRTSSPGHSFPYGGSSHWVGAATARPAAPLPSAEALAHDPSTAFVLLASGVLARAPAPAWRK